MSYEIAKVMTNSSEDTIKRVKIKYLSDARVSDLVLVLNEIPLNVGDMVLVDTTDQEEPFVWGKVRINKSNSHAKYDDANHVLESVSALGWSSISMNGPILRLENGNGLSIELNKNKVIISDGKNADLSGVPKVVPLLKSLNSVEESLNSLKKILNKWSPAFADGIALKTLLQSWSDSLPISSRSELEDIYFIH